MAEVATQTMRDLEKSRGEDRRTESHGEDRRHTDKKEDLTPVPTQAELDERTAGSKEQAAKDRKELDEQRAKAPKAEPPYPSQEQNDEIKAKLFNTTVEQERERDEAEKKAAKGANAKDAPEDLTPTPTQDELDAQKEAVMYQPPGSGDPQKAKAEPKQKQLEAHKPVAGGNYNTRTVEHHNTKSE
jgi:hypothetical protein